MTTLLPQQIARVQYVADGITTVYPVPFLFLLSTDISVFVAATATTTPIPAAQIQPLNTAYTVQNFNNLTGGQITFQANFIPVTGAIITIVRTMQVGIDTDFSLAQNFNGQNLDDAFERVVLIMQDLYTSYTYNALSYAINTYLPSLTTNMMPALTGTNQVWITNNGVIIAGTLTEGSDVTALRSQLASEVEGGDGASIVGYYDVQNDEPTTVAAYLNSLPTLNSLSNPNLILGGFFTNNPFQRGSTFSAAANGTYIADRFKLAYTGSGRFDTSANSLQPTVAQSSLFGTQSLQLLVSTAQASLGSTDFFSLDYVVEGYDFVQIAGQSAMLSFWVYTSVAGVYNVSFRNSGNNQSYVGEYTVNAINTWQYIKVALAASPSGGTWNYGNGVGLKISFVLAAGSSFTTTPNVWTASNKLAIGNQVNVLSALNNIFNIDRVKLEAGTIATDLVPLSFADELTRLQRYFEMSYNIGALPGTSTIAGSTQLPLNTNAAQVSGTTTTFKGTKRDTPTMVIYDDVGNVNKISDPGAGNNLAVGAVVAGMTCVSVSTTAIANQGIGYHFTADADF